MQMARSVRNGAAWRNGLAAALLLVAPLFMGALQGCSCRDDAEIAKTEKEKQEQEKLKKEKTKPKPDFEPFRLTVQPIDPQTQVGVKPVKPGYWTSVLVNG